MKELRKAAGLREEIAILGKYQFQNCHGEPLREWLNRPILKIPRLIPILLLLTSATCLVLGVCGYDRILSWLQIAPVITPLLLAQAAIGLALMREVRAHIQILLGLIGDVVVLRQGIELINRQEFHSAKLRALTERLRTENAAVTIRKLERRLVAIDRREDIWLYGFSLWLSAGTQIVLSIERWRERNKSDFENWLDAWAEFEALNALAGYSWEHPDYVFPALIEGEATFEAEGLGHPLLPRDCCVGNDLAFNGSTAFYVVSGSNMARRAPFSALLD